MLIRVSLVLSYLLRLPNGNYSTGAEGGSLSLQEQYVPEANGSRAKRTAVFSEFEAAASISLEHQLAIKNREADALLRRTNRLIRWYRSQTRQAAIVEVTRVQASPFVFTEQATQSLWGDDLTFEADPPMLPATQSAASIARAVRSGMAGSSDPQVADLFLLDAEQALRDGRFRETVLFCWSTIDTTFNMKYEALVDQMLVGEWADSRNWLKDTRFGMKNKMSAILFLTTGRSLFREPDDLWANLAQSYTKRNNIIHRGETSREADAELALLVARQVVKLMASLKPKKSKQ
jgi:hypothetical protein